MAYPIADAIAKNLLDEFGDHSISLAISYMGNLIYSKGFGYTNTGGTIPTTTETQYRIASVSKPITSTAIHILIERELLNYNDLVFGDDGILRLPGLSQESLQAVQNITVDHLLLHCSGLTRSTHKTDHIVPTFEKTNEFIEHIINQTPKLDFEPGSQYSYSNIGYILLAEIITQVSGQAYPNFVADEILQPLGIKSIVPGDENQFAEKEVTDYQSVHNNGRQTLDSNYYNYQMKPNLGAGGWVATPESLLKFISAIKGHSEIKILNRDTIDNMLSPKGPNPHMARGWQVNPYGSIWHTGTLSGQDSALISWDNGISYALIANRDGRQWDSILQEVTDSYGPKLREFGEKAVTSIFESYLEANPNHLATNEIADTADSNISLENDDAMNESEPTREVDNDIIETEPTREVDDAIIDSEPLVIEDHGNIYLLQGNKKSAFAIFEGQDDLIIITNKKRKQYSTREGRWQMLAIEGTDNEAKILWLHNPRKKSAKLKTYPYRLNNDKRLGIVFSETSGRPLEAHKLNSGGAQKLQEEFGLSGNSSIDTTKSIMGSPQRDRLNGTQRDDHLLGYGSADLINGNDGDDLIDPGLSTQQAFDKVKGGAGSDTFVVKDGYHFLIRDFNQKQDILDFSGINNGYNWESGKKSTKILDPDGNILAKLTSSYSQDSVNIVI